MAGNGGSSAGKIDYPAHVTSFHSKWLGTGAVTAGNDMTSLMNALITGVSPYSGEVAYDGLTVLAANQTRYDVYNTVVTGLNQATDWNAAVDNAVVKAADTINVYPKINLIDNDMTTDALPDVTARAATEAGSPEIQALVTAFDTRVTKRQARAIARFTAGLADVNAVMSSAFAIGLMQLEAEAMDEINEYDAKVQFEIFSRIVDIGVDRTFSAALLHLDARYRTTLDGTAQQLQQLQFNTEQQRAATALQTEINRIKVVQGQEQTDRNVELDVADALWDISVFQYGGNFLASAGGGTFVPKGVSRMSSAIGGALSGAGSGAKIGSAIPGVGTVIGGVAGGLLGLAGGLLS